MFFDTVLYFISKHFYDADFESLMSFKFWYFLFQSFLRFVKSDHYIDQLDRIQIFTGFFCPNYKNDHIFLEQRTITTHRDPPYSCAQQRGLELVKNVITRKRRSPTLVQRTGCWTCHRMPDLWTLNNLGSVGICANERKTSSVCHSLTTMSWGHARCGPWILPSREWT